MLIFDINSFPKGLNLSVWMEMHNKGIALYDSLSGKEPLDINDGELSLIDINTVDREELQKISDFVDNKIKEDNKNRTIELKTVIENNKKLVNYLKKSNDEYI